jgi:adenosylcobinamide kinase/adenosylcobinamide-phosphate guanylyltransferase
MKRTVLIIGGCRSGKSKHALKIGSEMLGNRNLFIATCVPRDPEMVERVKRHQMERDLHWQTIEEPVELDACICQPSTCADLILIDCLTLWVSNLMVAYANDADVIRHVDALCDSIDNAPCPVILVTNEVGCGIVPDNALARRFRDLTGWTNQRVASACGQVVWMVAGIPVTIKNTL